MLINRKQAFDFLAEEVSENSEFEKILWQDVSYLNEFFRINLKIIKENLITVEEFFRLFVSGEKLHSIISYSEWKSEWQLISQVISEMKLPIKNFHREKDFIEEALQRNNFVFHHSKIYRENYYPHYRIIGGKQFKQMRDIFPKIWKYKTNTSGKISFSELSRSK